MTLRASTFCDVPGAFDQPRKGRPHVSPGMSMPLVTKPQRGWSTGNATLRAGITIFCLLILAVVAAAAPANDEPTAKRTSTVDALQTWLQEKPSERPPLAEQPWASQPLGRDEAQRVQSLLWQDHLAAVRNSGRRSWRRSGFRSAVTS